MTLAKTVCSLGSAILVGVVGPQLCMGGVWKVKNDTGYKCTVEVRPANKRQSVLSYSPKTISKDGTAQINVNQQGLYDVRITLHIDGNKHSIPATEPWNLANLSQMGTYSLRSSIAKVSDGKGGYRTKVISGVAQSGQKLIKFHALGRNASWLTQSMWETSFTAPNGQVVRANVQLNGDTGKYSGGASGSIENVRYTAYRDIFMIEGTWRSGNETGEFQFIGKMSQPSQFKGRYSYKGVRGITAR